MKYRVVGVLRGKALSGYVDSLTLRFRTLDESPRDFVPLFLE